MIALAVLLLIVGVVLLLLPIPLSNKDNVGWLLVAAGVILLVAVLLLGAVDEGSLGVAKSWG